MKTKQLTIPAITTMTSLAIVKLINTLRKEEGNLTELRHSDFLAKIELEFLEEINERKISLVNYKDKKGEIRKQYELNKTQTIQILMSESKTVRRAVVQYVEHLEKENELLRNELVLKEQARSEARLEYKPMSTALKETRAALGKSTEHFHYSNEANLINLVVFGATSKKLKEQLEITDDESLRDNFTALQIKAIQDIQKHNTTMLEMGLCYDTRRLELSKIFNRKWAELMLEEHIRLEA
jgi:phage regulator Rha-like protein